MLRKKPEISDCPYELKIELDSCPTNPLDDWDHGVKLICAHQRYTLGTDQMEPEDLATEYLAYYSRKQLLNVLAGNIPSWVNSESALNRLCKDDLIEAVEEAVPHGQDYVTRSLEELENCKQLTVMPLYLYDHSGITISTGPFSCPWDSGQVGFAIIEWDSDYWTENTPKKLKTRAQKDAWYREVIEGVVKAYDAYLTGQVFGFVITDPEYLEELDSCWGFYSEAAAREEGKRSFEGLQKQWLKNALEEYWTLPVISVSVPFRGANAEPHKTAFELGEQILEYPIYDWATASHAYTVEYCATLAEKVRFGSIYLVKTSMARKPNDPDVYTEMEVSRSALSKALKCVNASRETPLSISVLKDPAIRNHIFRVFLFKTLDTNEIDIDWAVIERHSVAVSWAERAIKTGINYIQKEKEA